MNPVLLARAAAVAIKLATLEMKLTAFARIELRYRFDQLRAPRGTRTGGQWINDPRSTSRDRRLVADLTDFGILKTQMRWPDGMLTCVYDFGAQKWIIMYKKGMRQLGCLAMMHQSHVFPYGTRLNDN